MRISARRRCYMQKTVCPNSMLQTDIGLKAFCLDISETIQLVAGCFREGLAP